MGYMKQAAIARAAGGPYYGSWFRYQVVADDQGTYWLFDRVASRWVSLIGYSRRVAQRKLLALETATPAWKTPTWQGVR